MSVTDSSRSAASTSGESVHERLRDAILTAHFRPGSRLVEGDIAEWLEVSRTPVREALLALREEGLVIRSKGWIVRDHAPAEILRIVEARASIEGAVAYIAAGRISEEQLAALEALAARMVEPGISRRLANELNNEFHDLITEAADNALLAKFHRQTRINYWNFNTPVIFTPDDDARVAHDHEELIAALRGGEAERAERIARAHVGHTASILAQAFGLDEQ
ncbi:GntR family transcriptional regulator [Agromyces rhizosphaerae]|uniref:GntR family transcriptional regulator n=1 Tax=Agromyces rhizosphaerae TaxID=88374 RepID=A0A9W6CRK5_9MICO|nr:GntR family transcriptional regulator [Agromyces rhizosphaerae]GLI27596.1 GntR family transcriptional regulator [Agromyces rhizosphaerae]